MLKTSFASLGAIFVVVGACGGKTVDGQDAGQDAGTFDASPPANDSGPPTQIDGGACNALTLPGKPVTVDQIASDPPPFAGVASPLPLGRFDLVAMTIYTGPGGASGTSNTVDARAQFSAAKNGFILDSISSTNGGAPLVESATATPNGSDALDFTPFCPTPDATITIYYTLSSDITLRVLTTPTQTIDERFVAVP